MKLALHDNEFETNMEVKSQDFKIGNASKIIGILRNFLYQHKVRTTVQEYMSNARDAMREAKSTKKIVVTVPNQLNPVFKVRDFGPGITPQRMSKVFIQYGESTKDGSNEETGGFGIGAKSAWAYTDSFTIVSVTGGRKRTYVAHTGVNNQGRLDMIADEPSVEETGTEIQIAVKPTDLTNFKNSIWRACYFWNDAEYPEFKGVTALDVPNRDTGVKVGNLGLIKSDSLPFWLGLESNFNYGYISFVIDGIPYAPSKELLKKSQDMVTLLKKINCNAVIHVGNGILDIPATRESIADNDFNKEAIGKIADKVMKEIEKYVKSEFNKAKTYAEWLKAYREMDKMLGVDEYSKRGDYSIRNGLLYCDKFKNITLVKAGVNRNRRVKGTKIKREEADGIALDDLNHLFYLDNEDETIVTQNRRILEKNDKKAFLLIAAEQFSPPVFSTAGVVTKSKTVSVTYKDSVAALKKIVSDIGAIPLSSLPYTVPVRAPREKRLKEKEAFTIHAHLDNGGKSPSSRTIEDIRVSKEKFLYVKFNEYDKFKPEFREMHFFVDSLGYRLCALTDQVIKIVSKEKQFKSYESWLKTFKPDQKVVSAIYAEKCKNRDSMLLLKNATDKIKHKEIAKMLEVYGSIFTNGIAEVPKRIQNMVSKEIKEFMDDDANLTKVLNEKYPLIVRVGRFISGDQNIANELVLYINAKV